MTPVKKQIWMFLGKITLSIAFLYGGLSMAGDYHPPPRDAPKTDREFKENLVKAKQGDAFAQYVTCLAYYHSRVVESDIVAAVAWCTRAAEQGLVNAQFYLGYFYKQGHGSALEANGATALHWFRQAAAQGHKPAQYYIGEFYENGSASAGINRDHQAALEWYRLAAPHTLAVQKLREIPARYEKFQELLAQAKAGDAESQFLVCFSCIDRIINGNQNLDPNLIKADCGDNPIEWGIQAANQGFNQARFYLGRYYLDGKGVEQDIEKALYWFRLSAENDTHGGSALHLAGEYEKGGALEMDISQAIYWYELAAQKNNPYAKSALRRLREQP